MNAPSCGLPQTPAKVLRGVRALRRRPGAWAAGLVLLLTVSTPFTPRSGLAGVPDPRPALPGQPNVTETSPAHDAVGVPLYAWFVVQFSERMNTSDTQVFLDPPMDLTPHWLNNDVTLVVTHGTDLPACTTFRAYADGTDVEGENVFLEGQSLFIHPDPPNPWMFTTACPAFTITRTDPADGQTGAPVFGIWPDPPNISVWFSGEADPSSLQVTISPWASLNPVWQNGNTRVMLYHGGLQECTRHAVTISLRDRTGDPLANVTNSKPNPWVFDTVCIRPKILKTDPPDGAVGVEVDAPIEITFATVMDRTTVTIDISPTPASPFDWRWEIENRAITLTHAWFLRLSTTYTVTVTGNDTHGTPLEPGPVPNPWSFTTSNFLPAPRGLHVARSSPDIVLTWEAPEWATSYLVYGSTDKFAPWPWGLLDEVSGTTYRHADADADALSRFYIVRAKDPSGTTSGNSSMGVRLALDFTVEPDRTNIRWVSLPYRSDYNTAKDISEALTATNIDFVLKHDPSTQRSVPWYFFRGRWQGTDFPLEPGDLLSISPRISFIWVVNGTDGPEALSFARYPPPNGNVHLVSLPPTSAYAMASEVVVDIEGGLRPVPDPQIVEIARWDPIAQRLVRFVRIPGGWGGTDFALMPGEGLYVVVSSAFSWTPRLITPERP